MNRQHSTIHRITAVAVLLTTFIGYLFLLAPSISFRDCGEYVATGTSPAIPHPREIRSTS
jgi:hypothetical protein